MKLFKLSMVIILAIILSACGNDKNIKPSIDSNINIENVNVPMFSKVSKSGIKSGMISRVVLKECEILTQFPQFLKKHSTEINVNIIKEFDPMSAGYNLDVEFTQIVSSGNAFIGHRKYTQVQLTLYKDGKKISSANAARNSGGGFMGGFKGSCSVIGRTVDVNAKDIAGWLKNPYDDAHFGN